MAHPDVDEERLLRDMANGSITAFEQFYEKYASLVLHIALRIVKDRMEAEDICHDLFLEVWKKAGQYDPKRGSIEAWLAVMARSRSLDRMRKKQRLPIAPGESVTLEQASTVAAAEEKVLSRLDREVLGQALSRIPQAQARALQGMYYEAKTQRELAANMNRPLGTVKSLIRYGLDNIRKQLSQSGWLESLGGERKHE
ncbi:RNA polymerase sigma factor [Brevibacillus panacihumi]|uniref:RNA polymerase sigma factor n=1 Tax=Brevibacillus panacihumi TaxID=497735 RepID=UPI001FE75A02|nr:sigma-70 family RNA polymerase sigma factor [Brevibacillus panacihumi]